MFGSFQERDRQSPLQWLNSFNARMGSHGYPTPLLQLALQVVNPPTVGQIVLFRLNIGLGTNQIKS